MAKVIEIQKHLNVFTGKNKQLKTTLKYLNEEIESVQEKIKRTIKETVAYKSKYTGTKRPDGSLDRESVRSNVDGGATHQSSNHKDVFRATADSTLGFKPAIGSHNRAYGSDYVESSITKEKGKTVLKQLENKVEKRRVDMSSLVTQNTHQRDRIDELRREIILSKQIAQTLYSEYKELDDENKSNLAAKDKFEIHTETLKQATIQATSKNKQSTRDLKMSMKSIKSNIHNSNIRHKQNHPENPSAYDDQGSNSSVEELGQSVKLIKEAQAKEIKQTAAISNLQAKNEELRADIRQYNEILDEFYEMTGTSADDRNRLTTAISKFELEFKEYYKQNKDARTYADKVESLKRAKEAIVMESEIVMDQKARKVSKRDVPIEKYKIGIRENVEKIRACEKIKAESRRVIFEIKIAIPEIFRKIGCEPLKDNVYDDDELTDNNIIDYLATIEKRTDEILTLYDAKPADANSEAHAKRQRQSKVAKANEKASTIEAAVQRLNKMNEQKKMARANEKEAAVQRMSTIRDQKDTKDVPEQTNSKLMTVEGFKNVAKEILEDDIKKK